ncbi:DNA mismatch repair protein MutS, partial [Candidatus Woesebacteria bacterium]|nr:DNA mismatch repair protein MutS [Candidatus Woesebacteria bacterium]
MHELEFATPMMQQYLEVKKQYPDCLLFFRMGDFYELFLEDAVVGAKALNITLTSRARGKDGRIPMAGVPYHSVSSYLSKLVSSGFKVAICEQVSLPDGKGLVDRRVTRIVTPGTVLDDQSLSEKENNYIMALSFHGNKIGFALADLTTGLFHMEELDEGKRILLEDEIMRIEPSECVLFEEEYNDP